MSSDIKKLLLKAAISASAEELDAILATAPVVGAPQKVKHGLHAVTVLDVVVRQDAWAIDILAALRVIDERWDALAAHLVMHDPDNHFHIASNAAIERIHHLTGQEETRPRTSEQLAAILEILTRRGVDLNAVSKTGTDQGTALAALVGRQRYPRRSTTELLKEIDVFCAAGADLNLAADGLVCNLIEQHPKDDELWSGLLSRGLALSPAPKDGRFLRWLPSGPALDAIRQGRPDVMRRLLDAPALAPAVSADWVDPATGNNLLGVAAQIKTVGAAKALLQIPVTANPTMGAHVNEDGNSMLHLAAISCQLDLIRRALLTGGDVNATNTQGLRPIELIRRTGTHTEKTMPTILAMLRPTHDADPGKRVATATTTLHVAVRARSDAAVAAALKDGADIHAVDQSGLTALQLAVRSVRSGRKLAADAALSVMDRLRAAGADLNAHAADFISASLTSPARHRLLAWAVENGLNGDTPGPDGWPGIFMEPPLACHPGNSGQSGWVSAVHVSSPVIDWGWHVHPNRQSAFMAALELDLSDCAAALNAHKIKSPAFYKSSLLDEASALVIDRDRLAAARAMLNPDERALALLSLGLDRARPIRGWSKQEKERNARTPLGGFVVDILQTSEWEEVKRTVMAAAAARLLRRHAHTTQRSPAAPAGRRI